ncbi:MAG: hypothetical protein SFU99_12755 [Saprospiraceae bacterium]|nr:hypothetical protein [Saprospiraceae bacterium]
MKKQIILYFFFYLFSQNGFAQIIKPDADFRHLIYLNPGYDYNIISNNAARGQNCPSLNYRAGAASAIAIAIGEVYDGNYDYTTNLSSFQPNVLFISSDQSEDLGYDFQEKYQASLFPNYVHKKIVGTGHTGIITCRTAETLSYIKAYLEGL